MVDPFVTDGLIASGGEAGVEREGGMISIVSPGLAAGSAWAGPEVLHKQEPSLSSCFSPYWEPLSLGPLEVACSISFPITTFVLAGKPCSTRELFPDC